MKLTDLRLEGEKGLVPVIVQDAETKEVLMLAYADLEALRLTMETGLAHFWSRSRKKLWLKGEESGNFQNVVEVRADCDGDAVLYIVNPKGPACHTGNKSCFHNPLKP
ncbi:MAG: phosphoribosyl-AMP cyclohydrolase [Candidatus Caldarchaeum sp.]|nr:phosphoribosyl-AMP cyclohydrolase [Candidatus Caldarchaeum sp.]